MAGYQEIVYINQEKLVHKILTKKTNYIIFDVREDDYIGGHIKGSNHIPANSFINNIQQVRNLIEDKLDIIFHCQESIVRSPQCIRILIEQIPHELKNKNIYLLYGGFDQWIRNFWNTELVEDYNNDYYGYDESKQI